MIIEILLVILILWMPIGGGCMWFVTREHLEEINYSIFWEVIFLIVGVFAPMLYYIKFYEEAG